eukprot:5958205-Amphidinium_carterae.1
MMSSYSESTVNSVPSLVGTLLFPFTTDLDLYQVKLTFCKVWTSQVGVSSQEHLSACIAEISLTLCCAYESFIIAEVQATLTQSDVNLKLLLATCCHAFAAATCDDPYCCIP